MGKIAFETNIPQTIALKFANGKRVESRYNDYEVYYSLTDGRALYATPALAAKIEALAPAAGEEFTIAKREIRDGNKKRIEWQVTGDTVAQEAPAEPAKPAFVPAKPASEAETMTQVMSGALVAAIDSLAAAAKYAEQKHGWKLEFNEEDARAAANSIFIQFFKDRETRARYPQTAPERVNGGTTWRQ